jgi:hypothetical protein
VPSKTSLSRRLVQTSDCCHALMSSPSPIQSPPLSPSAFLLNTGHCEEMNIDDWPWLSPRQLVPDSEIETRPPSPMVQHMAPLSPNEENTTPGPPTLSAPLSTPPSTPPLAPWTQPVATSQLVPPSTGGMKETLDGRTEEALAVARAIIATGMGEADTGSTSVAQIINLPTG